MYLDNFDPHLLATPEILERELDDAIQVYRDMIDSMDSTIQLTIFDHLKDLPHRYHVDAYQLSKDLCIDAKDEIRRYLDNNITKNLKAELEKMTTQVDLLLIVIRIRHLTDTVELDKWKKKIISKAARVARKKRYELDNKNLITGSITFTDNRSSWR